MSTWEERMPLRAQEREVARAALVPEMGQPCEIGDPDIAIICSCGQMWGCFSVAVDSRYWSDDPAEEAAVQREHQEWLDSISCLICGKRGVVAQQDWGQ